LRLFPEALACRRRVRDDKCGVLSYERIVLRSAFSRRRRQKDTRRLCADRSLDLKLLRRPVELCFALA
jgi:hypothetical protein